MMQYRNLGSAGVKVSNLCLGAMTFGEPDEQSFMYRAGADEAVSHAILDKGLEHGINFIDTADAYGPDGMSERIIGNWFEARKNRDEVVLATKFRLTTGTGPNRSGASRFRIVKCCEDSLRRLKTDHIDLYQIHMQDTAVPEAETLRALDDLVRAGKVLYVGCSNYEAHRLMSNLRYAEHHDLSKYVTLQAQYNLLVRDIEREHVPLCSAEGLGLLTWSPLANGFLTGKVTREKTAPAGTRLGEKGRFARYDVARNWDILDAVHAVAADVDASPAAVSIAWLLANPRVTSVIIGARTLKQLEENMAAANLELSAAHLAKLDQASAIDLGYPYTFIATLQNMFC